MTSKRILCFGEILWDCLPRGLFLGGAPLNVAYHLRQLGHDVVMTSAVGSDFLGEETLERLKRMNLSTDTVTVHDDIRTGAVKVHLSEKKDASYEILSPAAWDNIPLSTDELQRCDALVYGSLAMRGSTNRDVIEQALAQFKGLKVCDINLRPTFNDDAYALELIRWANIAKLNHEELAQLSGIAINSLDELRPAIEQLVEMTGTSHLCVTLGADGAAHYDGKTIIRAPGKKVEVVDTVGAGDAFMGRFIHGVLANEPIQSTLEHASRLGAFLASCDGAQPEYAAQEYL